MCPRITSAGSTGRRTCQSSLRRIRLPGTLRRRNDAESINRGLEASLYLTRAHSMGQLRQEVEILGSPSRSTPRRSRVIANELGPERPAPGFTARHATNARSCNISRRSRQTDAPSWIRLDWVRSMTLITPRTVGEIPCEPSGASDGYSRTQHEERPMQGPSSPTYLPGEELLRRRIGRFDHDDGKGPYTWRKIRTGRR